MNRFWIATIFAVLTPIMAFAVDEPRVPGTVKALWADFGPAEPLDERGQPAAYTWAGSYGRYANV